MYPRNLSKLAIVIPEYKSLSEWYRKLDGIFALAKDLENDFRVRIFGYCVTPAVIPIDKVELQVTDNDTSLRYWIDSFEPKYAIGYRGGKRELAKIKDCKEIIYLDDFLVNSYKFRDLKLHKTIGMLSDTEFYKAMLPNSVVISDMTNYEEANKSRLTFLLNQPDEVLINQSMGVLTNTPELAIKALSCNVPVLTTKDIGIKGVWSCPEDDEEIRGAFTTMIMSFDNDQEDLYESFIKGKFDTKLYAESITKELKNG